MSRKLARSETDGRHFTSRAKRARNRRQVKKFWKDVRAGRKPFPKRSYAVKPLAERFWAKVKKGKRDECWLWTGGLDPAGYGKIGSGPPEHKTLRASRVSLMLHKRKLTKGRPVCHRCDNPRCVNPRHLRTGTPQSNMDERAQRGRKPVGSQVRTAKLTEAKVREIKRTKGKVRFGALSSTVSMILSGKIWRHVK